MTPITTGPATATKTLHPSLPAGPRPEPPGALAASAAFGWRAVLKIKHVPEQLFDVIAIPVVFTLMFTYLFGGALADSARRYLQFILPGTLVMAVLLVTMYGGVGLNADGAKGVSDRFRSLPIWRPAPIAGALLLGDVARYLLTASLVIALGLGMGFGPAGGAVGVLAGTGILVLFALSLSWARTTLGLFMRTPQVVMSVGSFVLFPADPGEQRLRPTTDHAGLASGLRPGQSSQPPGERRARPHARSDRGRPGGRGARRLGGTGSGLRARHGLPLRQAALTLGGIRHHLRENRLQDAPNVIIKRSTQPVLRLVVPHDHRRRHASCPRDIADGHGAGAAHCEQPQRLIRMTARE